MIGSLILGAVIGVLIVAAVIASGGALLVVAAAVAGAICITAAAGAAGERLGEAYDNDNVSGDPCSKIVMGYPTVWIENMLAARMTDPTLLCKITKTPAAIKQGSADVYIGKLPAARHNDTVTCTGKILPTTQHTFIGGPTADSGAPYQATLASQLHDAGTFLEEVAKWSGYAALALGGAAVIAVGVAAGLAASAAGAGLTAAFGAGTLAAIPGALGLGAGLLGSIGGAKGGAAIGGLIDSAAGYTDGRFSHFTGTWGGIAGGFAGGKVAEFGLEVSPLGGKSAEGGVQEGTTAGDMAKVGDGGKVDVVEPARVETTEPVKTETVEPVKTETVDPVKTETVDPAKTETVDPAKTKTETTDPAKDPTKTETTDPAKDPTKTETTDPAKDPTKVEDPAKVEDPNAVKEPLTPRAEEIVKKLNPQLQEDIAASPKLREQLNELANRGKDSWDVESDPAMQGAHADRTAGKIKLGNGYDDVGVLAHEVGHAKYDFKNVPPDPSMTGDQYVEANLKASLIDEGHAKFNEFEIRQDILDHGGRDIGNRGAPEAQEIYDSYRRGEITKDQAIEKLGDGFGDLKTSTTGETYREYYSKGPRDYWDKTYEPWLKAQQARQAGAQGGGGKGGGGASPADATIGEKPCSTCDGAAEAPKASEVTAPKEGATPEEVASAKEWVDELMKKGGVDEHAADNAAKLEALEKVNREMYDKVQKGEISHPNTTPERLKMAVEGDVDGQRVPLTYKDRAQFDRFQGELKQVFESEGITDAQVVQLGSATNGYKGNPGKYADYIKGGGTPEGWAQDGVWKPSSDTDFAITSDQALVQAQQVDAPLNTKYGVFKNGELPSDANPTGKPGIANSSLGQKLQALSTKWNQEIYGEPNPANGGFDFKLNPTRTNIMDNNPTMYKGPDAPPGGP